MVALVKRYDPKLRYERVIAKYVTYSPRCLKLFFVAFSPSLLSSQSSLRIPSDIERNWSHQSDKKLGSKVKNPRKHQSRLRNRVDSFCI